MRVLHVSGSPAHMGEAMGESLRDEVSELYARRLENALDQARRFGGREVQEADLLRLARACLPIWEGWDPEGVAELRGIARGARRPVEEVVAMNGLTDLRDALAWGSDFAGGCSAFLVQRDASGDGRLWCGQTWDLATDNRPFVVGLDRRPDTGPRTWCVTTAGCLPLMGLNEHGIAVGTTNLRTVDARPGVPYVGLIRRALAASHHAEAVASITGAPRAGGHVYTVADAEGHAAAIECTTTRAAVIRLEAGLHVHTNHCLVPAHAELEADTPKASSLARHERLSKLLDEGRGRHEGDSLRALLADREGGDLAICRDDTDGISTNAAFVACPERPEVWACAGPPCRSEWIDLLTA